MVEGRGGDGRVEGAVQAEGVAAGTPRPVGMCVLAGQRCGCEALLGQESSDVRDGRLLRVPVLVLAGVIDAVGVPRGERIDRWQPLAVRNWLPRLVHPGPGP